MQRVTTLVAALFLVLLLGLVVDAVAQSEHVDVSGTLVDGRTTPRTTSTVATTATAVSTQPQVPYATEATVTMLPVTGGESPGDPPSGDGAVIIVMTLLVGCAILVAGAGFSREASSRARSVSPRCVGELETMLATTNGYNEIVVP